jgi:hypothetical protein
MANASFVEYELFCPVCNVNFKQLVVLHKLPKNFNIDGYLAGMVERHDHAAYQKAKAERDNAASVEQSKKKAE